MISNKRLHTRTTTISSESAMRVATNDENLMRTPQQQQTNGGVSDINDYDDLFLFSSKLNELSIQDRSDALNDIHGIIDQEREYGGKTLESPEVLKSRIEDMTNEICLTMKKEEHTTIGIRQALKSSPNYVDQLKLRFLRALSHDSQSSARRMIEFFNLKLELFGANKLGKDITMNDLTKEENLALQRGIIQLLPYRDRAGRAVILADCRVTETYPATKTGMVMRAMFYFLMAALKDEETQQTGTVIIWYGVGHQISTQGRSVAQSNLFKLPNRVVAFHCCKDSALMDHAIRLVWNILESKFLCRVRLHSGSHVECIYTLMTFGIPRDAIPIADDGTLSLTGHHKIMESLRRRECTTPGRAQSCPTSRAFEHTEQEEGSAATIVATSEEDRNQILIPSPLDIIAGRGRHAKTCMGALRLQNMLAEYRNQYDNASCRAEKTNITQLILSKLKDSGCRFLISGQSGYTICDDERARNKIAHAFRNLRIKSKKTSGSCKTQPRVLSNRGKKREYVW